MLEVDACERVSKINAENDKMLLRLSGGIKREKQ